MAKALLRAKNNLSVNKDGTIRFDGSELGITHFIPRDIGTPVKKLIEMGYDKDIKGQPLERDDQVVEIYPQDVILPACDECDDEGSDKIMLRTAAFVDELLVRFYHQKPFFNIKRREDLAGHLIIGLAPHTSAGIMSRILGFSHAQALFAHPYWHAIQRRDLDGEETSIMLALDAFINFSRQYLPDRRGTRSVSGDTIIFAEENGSLKTREISEIVDGIIDKQGCSKEEEYDIVRNSDILKVLAFDSERKVKLMPVSAFIRHKNNKKLLKVKTTNGSICVTENHSLFVTRGKDIKSISA